LDGTIVVHGVDRIELAFVRFALVREAAADAIAYGSLFTCVNSKPICDKLGADCFWASPFFKSPVELGSKHSAAPLESCYTDLSASGRCRMNS
jgi:hypothetical protein